MLQDTQTNRILRLPQVLERTGLGRSTLYDKVNKGEFPKPINISTRRVGWLEHEVDAWIANCIAQSRS